MGPKCWIHITVWSFLFTVSGHIPWLFFLLSSYRSLLEKVRAGLFPFDAGARSSSERFEKRACRCDFVWGCFFYIIWAVPEMVGHLHLQSMDDSLKGKNREGLLDSPDSGLPPSPSPPFCSLSPGLIESRSGSCTTPVESHHGFYKREGRDGKLVRSIS